MDTAKNPIDEMVEECLSYCAVDMDKGRISIQPQVRAFIMSLLDVFKEEHYTAYQQYERKYNETRAFADNQRMKFNKFASSAIERMQERLPETFECKIMSILLRNTISLMTGVKINVSAIPNAPVDSCGSRLPEKESIETRDSRQIGADGGETERTAKHAVDQQCDVNGDSTKKCGNGNTRKFKRSTKRRDDTENAGK